MRKTYLLLLLLSFVSYIPAQQGVFEEFTYRCIDDQERPFILYTPHSIDSLADTKVPLLVFLHGAISNPNLKKDPLSYMQQSALLPIADRGKFCLMFSYGQKGATWFDDVGVDMLLGEIAEATNRPNIDRDRVFLSGFSDGGSGVFYITMQHPFPFAGCIAMNGSLAVASKLGAKNLFLANSQQLPTYVINTTQDMLYPLRQIRPTIEYYQRYNPNIVFKTPNGNHQMSYLSEQADTLIQFVQHHRRTPRHEFSWETPQSTAVAWFTTIEVDTLRPKAVWHHPYQLDVFNDKADMGLRYERTYRGHGLKVKGFKKKNSTAQRMGVLPNDIVLMMEKETLTSPFSPMLYAQKKRAGDSTSLTISRKGKEMVLNGKFNDGYHYPLFPQTLSTAKVVAKIDQHQLHINTSRITHLTIDMKQLKPYKIDTIYLNGHLLPPPAASVVEIDVR